MMYEQPYNNIDCQYTYPTAGKCTLELKFCYFANGELAKFKFWILLYILEIF